MAPIRRKLEVVPYGVDTGRFRPQPERRAALRARIGVADGALLAFSAGRLVRKKGFEHLLDAWARVQTEPAAILAIAGDGDLRDELRERARAAGVAERVRFLGNLSQDDVGACLSAADMVVVPSVQGRQRQRRRPAERPARGAGGRGAGDRDRSRRHRHRRGTRRDRARRAGAERRRNRRRRHRMAADPALRARLGGAARRMVETRFGWGRAAERFEAAYRRALANTSTGR